MGSYQIRSARVRLVSACVWVTTNCLRMARPQVLAASETDCEEEREGAAAGARRAPGSLASLAGADDALYLEHRRAAQHNKHPLFKKFRY